MTLDEVSDDATHAAAEAIRAKGLTVTLDDLYRLNDILTEFIRNLTEKEWDDE